MRRVGLILCFSCLFQVGNGQQWNHLGPGLNSSVYAIELSGTDVYAGGDFINAGGNSAADYVARWDGCQWHPLGPGLNGTVHAIAIVGSDIYVGGLFTLPYPYLARWDGTQWNPVGSGPPEPVFSIVVDGTNIIVGGGSSWTSGFVSQWDGVTWQQLGADLTGRVNDMVINGGDLYIGGNFDNADGNPDADGVARWDGSGWQNLGLGIQGGGIRVWDLLIYNAELYAGGPFDDAGGNPDAYGVAHWDGNNWNNLGIVPVTIFGHYSICVFQGSIYTTVGAGWSADDGIYRYDFTSGSWEVFQIVYLDADYPILRLACDDDNLYAGSFTLMGIEGEDYVCIARWGPPAMYEEIPGITDSLCKDDSPITLPTNIEGYTGDWSGPGVFNNEFDPYDQNGVIEILFTPDPGQCVDPEESFITVVNLSPSNLNLDCDENGTPLDPSDDFIVIHLNAMGYHLGTNYSVNVSSGTITPGTGLYNVWNDFQLQPGSAGNGNVTLTITDNAALFCSFEFEIEDPGTCSEGPPCPTGNDTVIYTCPLAGYTNNVLPTLGLPIDGTWEPPIQDPSQTFYNACLDSNSYYTYVTSVPDCPDVVDTAHFELLWNPPCNLQYEACYTNDSFSITIQPYTLYDGNTYSLFIEVSASDMSNYFIESCTYDGLNPDLTNEVTCGVDWNNDDYPFHCIAIWLIDDVTGCIWVFPVQNEIEDWDCNVPPCNCANPPYAGEDNSINICVDEDPFDLTTILGGSPDPGGTWNPPLQSGGDMYDPAVDGSGTFIYIVNGDSDCPDDEASVTVSVEQLVSPEITGVPNSLCENEPPITLPTNQEGISGNWSGTGVSNNNFNPAGLNGTYTLTFTPNAGQCALPATTEIFVEAFTFIIITGIPDTLCQNDMSILLPTPQSGINGSWSGIGVSFNNFNPSGLNGDITLTFVPDADQCANATTGNIFVESSITPTITGIPDSLCQNVMPVMLPTIQNGITGSWSGPGVSGDMFSPIGQNGNVTLVFTPAASQCANPANVNIFVALLIDPSTENIPDVLCENDDPVMLPITPSGVSGTWSGPGVTAGFFNPAGLDGEITLMFLPDPDQCANVATHTLLVETEIIPLISGLPSTICETASPILLPILVSGIQGNWSGPGVSGNIFNPEDLSGIITLTFTPTNSQCAVDATIDLLVEMAITSTIMGFPDSICQAHSSIVLPTVQSNVTGSWSGQGVSLNIFNPIGLNGTYALTFTPDSFQCASATLIDIHVAPTIVPSITGVPSTVCVNDSILLLPTSQGGVIGNWYGPGVILNSFNPSVLPGDFMLEFIPDQGQCADTAQLSITVNSLPSFLNLQPNCDSSGQFYNVTFDITGGLAGSYTVNGIPVSGSVFTSSPITADSLHYTFQLDDGNGCGPVVINGSINCACATSAGTMDFAVSPLMICEGSGFEVVHNQDETLDPDDILLFVLHDQAGTQLGMVYAISDSISFNFPAGIQLNQVYYISAVAGSGNGNGSIDLNDPCLSVSQGIPITFYAPQATISPGSVICPDECFTYEVQFSGVSPFIMEYQVMASGIPFTETVLSNAVQASITLCPSDYGMTGGILDIIPVTLQDANCTITMNPFGNIATTVYESSFDMQVELCAGDSLIVNGSVYNQFNLSGVEIFHGAGQYGCDSIVQVMLSYYPASEYSINQALCYGSSITINGTLYDETNANGIETLHNASVNGCDSTIYIELTFDSVVVENLIDTLCTGESMVVHSITYNESNPSGSHLFEGGSILGCDSVLNVHLYFYPESLDTLELTLQMTDSVVINGTLYNHLHPEGVEIIAGGSYTGCDSIVFITLQFESIPLTVSIDFSPPSCFGENDAVITVNSISGGILPYTVILNNGNPMLVDEIPFEFTGLAPGFYTVIIEDALLNVILMDIEIPDIEPLMVNAGDDQLIQSGTNAFLHADASFNVNQWIWSPDDFLSCTDCPNPIVQMPDKDITYSLIAMDTTGCLATDDVAIFINKDHEIYVPDIFSPNGDGINDLLALQSNTSITKINYWRIYSRWGELVFEQLNLSTNDPKNGWDGKLRGQEMNPGVFIWVAQIEFVPGIANNFSGNVTLIK